MKQLNLYTNLSETENIKALPCMEAYEVLTLELRKEAWEQMDADVPALVVIDCAEGFPDVWEVVQQIQSRTRNVAFLFLLEKESFDIAYKASQYDSVSLLLKSGDKEEWNGRLEMCLDRLKARERILKERAQLGEYEFQKNHKIMERLLVNILNKPDEVEFLLPEINKRYGTRLGEGDYQAIIIDVNQYELCSQSSGFFKDVMVMTMHTLNLAEEVIVGYQEPYGLIGIVHYNKNTNISDRKRDYEKLWNKIMQLQNRYGEFLVSLSVGKIVSSISHVSESLKEAALAKEYRVTEGENLIYASDITDLQQDMENYLPERKRKELVRYVALGDVRHVNSWFLDFHQNLEKSFMNYPPAFAHFCWQVYCDMAEQEKTSQLAVFPEWKFFSLQHMFDGYERNRELEVLLLEICHMMAEGMAADQDIAVKAIAYMKVHYKEPINLEFIAEKCGLSTSYFSRKFKEQTGENYIDVLTDIRIREAQRLLGTTDMSVMEIIEEVGYCDDKHFRKLFYNITGLKPMEYRKKIRTEQKF